MAFEITTFQSSLLSLAALKGFLEDALRPIKFVDRADCVASLSSFILINVHSFNQEWKRFESFARNDLEVRQTLKLAGPFVRRVRSWKGLSRLRSGFLAHEPFDKDDQSLVDVRGFFGDGKAPSELWEQILLGECAVYAIGIALTRHDVDRRGAVEIVYKDGPHHIELCGISTEAEFNEEIEKLRGELIAEDADLAVMFARLS